QLYRPDAEPLRAMALHREGSHDLRMQRVTGHRTRREPVARNKLLGDRRSPDERPALEDADLQARSSQVAGCDHPVVASADDGGVERALSQIQRWTFGSRRTTLA